MKLEGHVTEIHLGEAQKPSTLDPNKSVPVVAATIAIRGEIGDTGWLLQIQTTDPARARRFEVGQAVEVTVRTMGQLAALPLKEDTNE